MSWPKQSVQGNRNTASAERASPAGGSPDTSKGIGQANLPPRRTWLTFAVITMDQAMSFVVTAGSSAPDRIRFWTPRRRIRLCPLHCAGDDA